MKRFISIFLVIILAAASTTTCIIAENEPPELKQSIRIDDDTAPDAAMIMQESESNANTVTGAPAQISDDLATAATEAAANEQDDLATTATEAEAQAEDDLEMLENETQTQPPEEIAPPMFGFIDAHADTITRALLRNQGLFRNNIHVDFERLFQFGAPVQVFVLWCADGYVADAFNYTNSLIDFFESEVAKHSDIIEIALTLEDMERNARNNKISAVLSIEGGEALMGDIKNLDHFYDRGVRIMSLTWNRENELGYGQATGDRGGLKPFGIECLKRMEELGIILDVSHINEAGFWDAHRLSSRPYMASHSNSYSVRPHDRNLTDNQIKAIVDSRGIVGLALYPLILSQNSIANTSDIMAHIKHFMDLGAVGHLGLGCDLDGFATMPEGLKDVTSLRIIAKGIAESFGEDASKNIMSGNFHSFLKRYFDD